MSDQQENEIPVPDAVAGIEQSRQVLPGALLAAQRHAKGWSVEHIASQLKFAPRQVVAMEADNYAALPGPVIVRGFVRAYAKLLGLDPSELAAALPQDGIPSARTITPQRTLSAPFSESPLPLGNRRKISLGVQVGVVLLMVVIVAVVLIERSELFADAAHFSWLKQGGKTTAAQDESLAKEPAQSESAEQAELPPEVQDGPDKLKQDKPDAALDNAPGGKVADQVAAQSPGVPLSPVLASSGSAALADSAGKPVSAPASELTGSLNISKSKDLLRLNFREDSWVEIRRSDKSTLISRLLKAGTSESFDISEPVLLVIGNAAGVDASLRGTPLDLQAGSSSNVARLNLK